MVRINKSALPKKKVEGLFVQLDQVIGELKPGKVNVFLQSLIGPEEKLMLAKRLAVLVMLREGYSDYRIAKTLKLSPSTIKNLQERQNNGAYFEVTNTLENHKKVYDAIVAIVESLVSVGGIMPSRAGLERYRGLRSTYSNRLE